MDFDVIFIVAAPRSGTKILRDTLGQHPKIQATERRLEEVWNYAQDDVQHDAYSVDTLTPKLKSKIRSGFHQRWNGSPIFLEKSVHHTVRIPYVREVFPEAQFIHIIRDGRDAIVSLMERWQQPIDFNYYLSKKAFELNPTDIVFYTWRSVKRLFKRFIQGKNRIEVWGPEFEGIRKLARNRQLPELCAIQWKKCVERVLQASDKLNSDQYFELSYENLMTSTKSILNNLASFLDLDNSDPLIEFGLDNYHTSSIGRWKNQLTTEEKKLIIDEIGSFLSNIGYKNN